MKRSKEEVEILGTPGGAKYKLWLIIGMVVIALILVGLLVWKGPSLLRLQQNNAPPPELNGYTPKAPGATKPGH